MRLLRPVLVVVCGTVAATLVGPLASAQAAAPVWPGSGQAAYAFGSGAVHIGPHAHTAPIASMAKVMTAYLVLQRYPLKTGANGFTMTVHSRDVSDRAHRVARGESTVRVRAGERLTERQALAALLLPSANNIAIMLARKVAGSVAAFVRRMNATAHSLHMTHTRYTDPSGFAASTRSRPGDQLVLARRAMAIRFFAVMVNRSSFRIPVAGRVRNTDTLLHHDGFAGIKTGSMSQSGGCFMFLSKRVVHGRVVDLYGVVMGQPGGDLIAAGLRAARRLADRVAPRSA